MPRRTVVCKRCRSRNSFFQNVTVPATRLVDLSVEDDGSTVVAARVEDHGLIADEHEYGSRSTPSKQASPRSKAMWRRTTSSNA